ncbi:hypothetical protein COU74_02085 [Candidatus Peregrinibacteria bacterium CG10_big_fil_rev_8_21_14_0_10_36_19]|nr:MAG: hypothetical protein COU74_02085 [Candidatus Peregrinibacteria bacterium CG10_big_fil_rev_8_21_14_0_10_36_19]
MTKTAKIKAFIKKHPIITTFVVLFFIINLPSMLLSEDQMNEAKKNIELKKQQEALEKQPEPKEVVEVKKDFSALARERFDTVAAAFTDGSLDSITCFDDRCDSVVYFNFNTLIPDLELVIRSNTAIFSNFKIKNTGTSHVTIFATLNGSTILTCNGSKGRVDKCE